MSLTYIHLYSKDSDIYLVDIPPEITQLDSAPNSSNNWPQEMLKTLQQKSEEKTL